MKRAIEFILSKLFPYYGDTKLHGLITVTQINVTSCYGSNSRSHFDT